MTAEVPKVSRSGRYNVKATMAALGIGRTTLYGISESLLPFGHLSNGRRCYYGDKILRYWHMAAR